MEYDSNKSLIACGFVSIFLEQTKPTNENELDNYLNHLKWAIEVEGSSSIKNELNADFNVVIFLVAQGFVSAFISLLKSKGIFLDGDIKYIGTATYCVDDYCDGDNLQDFLIQEKKIMDFVKQSIKDAIL